MRCRHCHTRLPSSKRPDAVFCSDACRARFHRGEAPRTALNGSRRPSRDGNGTRIYFTPADLDELIASAPSLSPAVARKIRAAYNRKKGIPA